MKKIVFILLSFCVVPFAQSQVAIKTSPVLFAVGALNAEVGVALGSNLSIAAGGLTWSGSLDSVETDDSVDFSVTEVHGRIDYWFSGAYKQGWYIGGTVSSMTINLKTTQSGVEFEGDISATGILGQFGYHWQWDSFFIDLGARAGTYNFDSKLEVEADDGSTQEEEIPAISSGGLEFNIGWVF